MRNVKKIIIVLIPFLSGLGLTYFLWRQTLLLAVIYVLLLIFEILFGRDRIMEVRMALFGILWGVILEIVGVKSGYHVFSKPDFWGIPFWLPIFWGYGFVVVKRISSIMYKDPLLKG